MVFHSYVNVCQRVTWLYFLDLFFSILRVSLDAWCNYRITECHGIQEMGYCMSGLGCVSMHCCKHWSCKSAKKLWSCESAPIHTCCGMHTLVLGIHSDSHEQSILQHNPQYEEPTNWSDPTTIIPLYPYIMIHHRFQQGPIFWGPTTSRYVLHHGHRRTAGCSSSAPRQMFRKLCEIPTPHDGRTVPRPDSPVAAAEKSSGGWLGLVGDVGRARSGAKSVEVRSSYHVRPPFDS